MANPAPAPQPAIQQASSLAELYNRPGIDFLGTTNPDLFSLYQTIVATTNLNVGPDTLKTLIANQPRKAAIMVLNFVDGEANPRITHVVTIARRQIHEADIPDYHDKVVG